MADITTFCTVGGLCFDLASRFIVKVPWNEVLRRSTSFYEGLSYESPLVRETQMARNILKLFIGTVRKMEMFQKDNDVNICSLHSAENFIQDFKKVLKVFDPEEIEEAEEEKLLQQLKYYITYMHSIMSNIMLESSYVTMQLSAIKNEPDIDKRRELTNQLTRCYIPTSELTDMEKDAGTDDISEEEQEADDELSAESIDEDS